MTESFLNDRMTLHPGYCLDVLARLEANSVDSVVTDPPYHLTSIVKRFGSENAAPAKVGKTGAYARASSGFMGKQWDGGDIAFRIETWQAILRVLKPGGHLLAFSGTRTYHRMVCAIEDAGFEIRDQIQWLYGSGFPKSHDVSKGIDRAAGAEREVVGAVRAGIARRARNGGEIVGGDCDEAQKLSPITEAATDAARQWSGFGTALKPACEPIVLARKPLSESTVAANVLKWGTGALNIDGCRVATDSNDINVRTSPAENSASRSFGDTDDRRGLRVHGTPSGRWPANVIHDGSDEVVGAFPSSDANGFRANDSKQTGAIFGSAGKVQGARGHDDSGSAARFFYTAKADERDIFSGCFEEVSLEWISEHGPCQATLLVDMGRSPGRVIAASGSGESSEWNTFLFGSMFAELSRLASKCIISTGTNSTTGLKIWNWLTTSLTSECTAVVSCETESGGSPAESAGNGQPSLIIILAKTASLPGASHALYETRLRISASAKVFHQIPPDAKRIFYTSKAGSDDRLGSGHPTVKPLDLMQYLVRLVTPPKGIVLDCFAGTGTTGEAAWREGFSAILIEREAEYCNDIRRRMALCMSGPAERKRESNKARHGDKPFEEGSLFA